MNIRCPTCKNGTLEIRSGKSELHEREEAALTLYKQGFTFREVAKAMGIKSVSNVFTMIKKAQSRIK